MNTFTRLIKSVRLRDNGRDQGLDIFYGNIARKTREGAPRFDESRRDYAHMREQIDRIGMIV